MAKAGVTDRAKPFSIRLTPAEKATLEARAGGEPLSVFIRKVLLDDASGRRVIRRQSPVRDGAALGRVLATLGQSGIGKNLNALALQANAGTLYFDENTKAHVRQACDDLRAIRLLLLDALGKQILADAQAPAGNLSALFHVRAGPGIAP